MRLLVRVQVLASQQRLEKLQQQIKDQTRRCSFLPSAYQGKQQSSILFKKNMRTNLKLKLKLKLN